MENFFGLMQGFETVFSPVYLVYAIIGCVIGNLIGVLPGLGPVGGIAVLIPFTAQLDVTGAIIMLAAMYYGAMFGGTITSVLMNVPGEAASAVTTFDGYPMAKEGRGGVALVVAAVGSFVGGIVSLVLLTMIGPSLSEYALRIGPPEIFGIMLLALLLVTTLAGRSPLKASIMALFGLLLATVGLDSDAGMPRLTLGIPNLLTGVDLVPVFIGLFGLGEILMSLEHRIREGKMVSGTNRLMPSREDMRRSRMPVVRGTFLGFFLGLIPGVGSVTPTFISYGIEKRLSRHPDEFGHGAVEGVAGPETTNNSYVVGALIPLLTLGIPANATIAVLMGAFIQNGITPGPLLFSEHADIVWPLIAALFLGSLILVILNIPMVGVWTRLLSIPYAILIAVIVGIMLVGSYTGTNTVFSVWLFLVFGVLGYVFKKLSLPLAPFALTFVLGGILEKKLVQSLQMSQGDFGIFIERPGSAGLIAAAVFVVLVMFVRAAKKHSSSQNDVAAIREEDLGV